MRVRAVILDVYGTLLEVGPPPIDAARRWEQQLCEMLGCPARLSLSEFAAACDQLVAREHAAARELGIAHPEVSWPALVTEVVPELAGLPAKLRDEFLFRQAQLWHTVRLMPGAAEVLRELERSNRTIGIASNAQAYTLRELGDALGACGLARSLFSDSLCFWSFEAGFAKPDPHVFHWLTARLRGRNILPNETLMVGDRLDNDIRPAQAEGWQTWHLTCQSSPDSSRHGGWSELWSDLSAKVFD